MFFYMRSARLFLIIFLITSIIYVSSYVMFSGDAISNNNYQSRLIKSLDSTVKSSAEDESIKTILLWNPFFNSTDFDFGIGREPFIKKNCPVTQCYITNDRNYLPVEYFDAIVYHTPTFNPKSRDEFPARRLENQLYMMYNTESPSTYPPESYVDDFINITATYRLDSDIFYPYFQIVDKDDNLIAPALHPTWLQPLVDENDAEIYMDKFNSKRKEIAWFVSNCNPSNNRMKYVLELKKYINVDIYGACGNTTCDKEHDLECKEMLKKEYFFYLSFENSNCLEYVSEKLANAYNSDTIPVVMNGAEMMQIGMPHSYLDVRNFKSPKDLATKMKSLMEDPQSYIEYFWWKKHYKVVQDVSHVPFCELCRLMHQSHWKAKRHTYLTTWLKGTEVNPMCKNNLYF